MGVHPKTFEEWQPRFRKELEQTPLYGAAWNELISKGVIPSALERQLWLVTRIEWVDAVANLRKRLAGNRKRWLADLKALKALTRSLRKACRDLEAAMGQLSLMQERISAVRFNMMLEVFQGPPRKNDVLPSGDPAPEFSFPSTDPKHLLDSARSWLAFLEALLAGMKSSATSRLSLASQIQLQVLLLIQLMTKRSLPWTAIASVLTAAHCASGTPPPEAINSHALQMLWKRHGSR